MLHNMYFLSMQVKPKCETFKIFMWNTTCVLYRKKKANYIYVQDIYAGIYMLHSMYLISIKVKPNHIYFKTYMSALMCVNITCVLYH